MSNQKYNYTPLMVLGTSSGAGKSLLTTALCRVLLRKGEAPIPFKGQNMSNNAWVDQLGGEMAYSQAVQAWAAGKEPSCEMNPVLLKPQGNCLSEVIHLGKSMGIAEAEQYYEKWFDSGWSAIQEALKKLGTNVHQNKRLVLEGAGSPVEVNLQHRDLTNLRLAKYVKADCLLVADIERGGVFAQIIGTLTLLSPQERSLIKGIIINRFRGKIELFDKGRLWLENETGIPVLGVMPWINELFPAEDSLDLLERKSANSNQKVEIAVIKLPFLSNFSDIDPIEAESDVKVNWINPGDFLGNPDAVIIPGSKQTIHDMQCLYESGLATQIIEYGNSGGNILGICGGLQMLGESLKDPYFLETEKKGDEILKDVPGMNLLPIETYFDREKRLKQTEVQALWPGNAEIKGFELHHGRSNLTHNFSGKTTSQITSDPSLGWFKKNNDMGSIVGTYIHGILDNGKWRRLWLNQIRKEKGIFELPLIETHHTEEREYLINKLADIFEENININKIL